LHAAVEPTKLLAQILGNGEALAELFSVHLQHRDLSVEEFCLMGEKKNFFDYFC